MFTIIFAKTTSPNPKQFIGTIFNTNTKIKDIKTFDHIVNSETLFAALIESQNRGLPLSINEHFDIIKTHPVHLRKSTKPPELTPTFRGKKYNRSLQRYRRNERKCILSERTWTRFFKPKHILSAYQDFLERETEYCHDSNVQL